MSNKMKYKKGLSEVVSVLIILMLSVVAVLMVWAVLQNSVLLSPDVDCAELSAVNSIKIDKACYLNSNEVLLSFSKNAGSPDFSKIRVSFDEAVFEISDGKMCSDVRRQDSDYGRVCVISQDSQTKLVFNIQGISPKIAGLSAYIDDSNNACSIGTIKIDDAC